VNSETADGDIVYTTVLSGIPLEKKRETMVVRPYAQYEINGKAVTIYGEVATGSLYDTAMVIKTAGGEAYENNKTYIDSIVAESICHRRPRGIPITVAAGILRRGIPYSKEPAVRKLLDLQR
jgi:hypothetical protein